MAAKFKYNVEVEQAKLTKALYNYQTKLNKSFGNIIKFGAIVFLQSAIKLTPQSKKRERDVDVKVRFFRNGQLHYGDIIGHDEKPGDKLFSVIPIKNALTKRTQVTSEGKTIGKWSFKIVWGMFKKNGAPKEPKAEVKRLRQISYRGIGKAGWWKSLISLGQSYKTPRNAQLLNTVPNAEIEDKLDLYLQPQITLINKTKKIATYFNTGAIRGKALKNARTRIMIMTREELKKLNGAVK